MEERNPLRRSLGTGSLQEDASPLSLTRVDCVANDRVGYWEKSVEKLKARSDRGKAANLFESIVNSQIRKDCSIRIPQVEVICQKPKKIPNQ